MTFTELAKRAGLSRSTFYKAVRNSRGLRPETIAQLDQALEWPPGACAQILNGGDPPPQPPRGNEQARVEARLQCVERQLAALWDAVARIDPTTRVRNAC
jgi:hypothetical protein